MSNTVPNRSARGCLTCKQRKKKCDETRPTCDRCREGDFHCLGYDHLNIPKQSSTSRQRNHKTTQTSQPPTSASSPVPFIETSTTESIFGNPSSENLLDVVAWRRNVQAASTIPRSVVVDSIEPDNLSSHVVLQLGRLGSRVIFGPLPYRLNTGLARLAQESSDVKRWSLYLGANLVRGLLDGTHQPNYISWIDRFQRQITNSSVTQTLSVAELEGRLSCMEDLVYYTAMVLDGRASYIILKQCLPFFLQLAGRLPELWAEESAISIYQVLNTQFLIHEMRKFVLWDTVNATAFGTAPLLHYNTAFQDPPPKNEHVKILDRSYGCPKDIVVILARINSWRVSSWMEQTDGAPEGLIEIEERLRQWTPMIDPDISSAVVARFAVQESWRQAALIYLYMGICRANSNDSRVEFAVQQIIDLAKTIEAGNPLEIHLCMPCLIAGIAARQESHRALMRKIIDVSRSENVWCIRGADFVPVLDHLWHGTGVDGAPVTWEDYVTSRCIMFPVEV